MKILLLNEKEPPDYNGFTLTPGIWHFTLYCRESRKVTRKWKGPGDYIYKYDVRSDKNTKIWINVQAGHRYLIGGGFRSRSANSAISTIDVQIITAKDKIFDDMPPSSIKIPTSLENVESFLEVIDSTNKKTIYREVFDDKVIIIPNPDIPWAR